MEAAAVQSGASEKVPKKFQFAPSNAFTVALKRELNALEATPGWLKKGYRQLRRKAFAIDAFAGSSYILLLMASFWWPWQWVFLLPFLALGIILIAFNIQHDGNHGGFGPGGRRYWLNRFMGWHLDLIGVSSRGWHHDHNQDHHTYPNTEHDHDIDLPPLARLAWFQEHQSWQRYQHVYLFFFYGFTILSWVFYKDLKPTLFKERFMKKNKKYDRPAVFGFVAGKVVFLSWSLFIPMALHPSWLGMGVVLLVFLAMIYVVSFVFMLVAQSAHVVENREFAKNKTDYPAEEWQIRVTADFSHSRLLGWAVGGLHRQIEHHLRKRYPHTVLDDVATVVRRVCAKHSVPYACYPTFRSALASHARHLRAMSLPEEAGA